LNLEVVLVDADRGRELIRERIEGIPLGFDLLSDENRDRSAAIRAGTGLDHRVGAGHALGESGVSETLGDGGSQEAVVLFRLIGKSEETEEDERANDVGPSNALKRNDCVLAVHNPRELEDTGVSPVGVSPGDPRANPQHSVRDNIPNSQWDGNDEIDGSQSDETPVAAVSQVAVVGDEISELLSPPNERTDGEEPIGSRDKTDD